MKDFIVTKRFAIKAESPEEAAKIARAWVMENPQAALTFTVRGFPDAASAIDWLSRQPEADVTINVSGETATVVKFDNLVVAACNHCGGLGIDCRACQGSGHCLTCKDTGRQPMHDGPGGDNNVWLKCDDCGREATVN